MRVLFIDQYFSTRLGISGTRGYEFARRMIKKGHKVTVITTASRYGSFFPQRNFIKTVDVEGIKVVSIKIPYHQLMSFPIRALSFTAFMFAATFVGIFQKRHDIVFATSTPLSIGFPGFAISLTRGTPFVFEVRDLWPRAPVELGVIRNTLLIKVFESFEKLLYRFATQIVTLSPGMKKGILETGVPAEKITLVPNAADLDLFKGLGTKATLRKSLNIEKEFLAVYAGAVGVANDLTYIVKMAKAMDVQTRRKIGFVIIGEGNDLENVKQRAKEYEIDNISFIKPVARKDIAKYMAAADLGLTLFKDLPILATNSPNKFFDYLAAGLPCAVNSHGWTRKLIEKADAGLYLPPDDPAKGAKRIVSLFKNETTRIKKGKNAKKLAIKSFSRGLLLDRLLDSFKKAQNSKTWGLEYLAKRVFDFSFAAASLVFLSPILLIISAAIKLDSKGPVFYRQLRVGKLGRPFSVNKFRTMVDNAEKLGLGLNVEEKDSRITRVGSFLREWSLDELPQLINILFFQMSLIGPRPALLEQVERYTPQQIKRFDVKPGLTGLSQVSGRNSLSWEKRIELDVRYINDFSLLNDLKIFFKTFLVIFSKEGLYEKDGGLDDNMNKDI